MLNIAASDAIIKSTISYDPRTKTSTDASNRKEKTILTLTKRSEKNSHQYLIIYLLFIPSVM